MLSFGSSQMMDDEARECLARAYWVILLLERYPQSFLHAMHNAENGLAKSASNSMSRNLGSGTSTNMYPCPIAVELGNSKCMQHLRSAVPCLRQAYRRAARSVPTQWTPTFSPRSPCAACCIAAIQQYDERLKARLSMRRGLLLNLHASLMSGIPTCLNPYSFPPPTTRARASPA